MDFLAVEYPGYGLYNARKSASRIKEDSLEIYDFLTKICKLPDQNIIIIGRSLGSGPASYLAANRKAFAQILISPFMTLKDVILDTLKFAPLMHYYEERFDNKKTVENSQSPTFLLHGQKDKIVPWTHSKELERILKEQKKVMVHSCYPKFMNHNFFSIEEDIANPILEFLNTLKNMKNNDLIGFL